MRSGFFGYSNKLESCRNHKLRACFFNPCPGFVYERGFRGVSLHSAIRNKDFNILGGPSIYGNYLIMMNALHFGTSCGAFQKPSTLG